MKKYLFIPIALLLVMASCSQDESLENSNLSLSNEVAFLVDNYETHLKGYSVAGPIVETIYDGIGKEEEIAFKHLMQEVLDDTYSKIDVSTRALINSGVNVGILKYTTCGSYSEFHYHQDNQDGGITNIVGDAGATYVDSDKNMEWRFCIVPGLQERESPFQNEYTIANYGGGVLLLSNLTVFNGRTFTTYNRFHDDEDKNNKNKITQRGGLTMSNNFVGASYFGPNTAFEWVFTGSSKSPFISFAYGVIANNQSDYTALITVDDENSSNASDATLKEHSPVYGNNSPKITKKVNYAGIRLGNTDTYYYIKRY